MLPERDGSGRAIIRTAAANAGKTYIAHFFEFTTGTKDSLRCDDWQGNTDSDMSIKFFDSNDVELTVEADITSSCVKTEVMFCPSFDYEIVSGNIHLITTPTEDLRFWCIGGIIEDSLPYYNVAEFVRDLNLRFIGADEGLETDGRASKFMLKETEGVPYDTNRFKCIFKHSTGLKHKVLMAFEYFR